MHWSHEAAQVCPGLVVTDVTFDTGGHVCGSGALVSKRNLSVRAPTQRMSQRDLRAPPNAERGRVSCSVGTTDRSLFPNRNLKMEILSSACVGVHQRLDRDFRNVRHVHTRHRLVLAAISILIAGSLARPVSAQYEAPGEGIGDPFAEARHVMLGVSVSHDSNLFRFSDVLGDTPSETITTAFARFRIDKPYAQQRFFLDAGITAYRYDRFSYLDFEGLDYRAAWDWHLTPRLSGTLSADRTQAPTQFQDTRGIQSNITIIENYAFNLDGWLFGGWHVLLGASQIDRTSEQSALQPQPDYREVRSEGGVRYLFQSGSEIAAVRRRIEGDQDSQLINNVIVVSDSNYQEDQSELSATWILTPKSTLTGRATYLDRHYDQVSQRDFSGTAGELRYVWLPTSTLRLILSGTRNIVPWRSLSSNYRASNTFAIAPTWQAAARTSVYLSLVRTYDEYPSPSSTTVDPDRKDTTTNAVLGLNWLPTRYVSFSASLQRQQRSSNTPPSALVEYDTTIARISASLLF